MKKFFIVLGVIILFIFVMPTIDVITGYERVNGPAYFIHDFLRMSYGAIVVLLVRYIRE